MSRRTRRRSLAKSADSTLSHAEVDATWNAFLFAAGLLFLARFLVPAESADEGETLWIVVGWLLLAVGTAWIALREGRFSLELSWPEAAVGLLAFGQVVSALAVVATAGDKRAAVNMLWEWLGVFVAFVLIRQTRRDPAMQRLWLSLILTAGVVLSGLGLWQRFVWYPQIQSDYREWVELSQSEAGVDPRGPATPRRAAT